MPLDVAFGSPLPPVSITDAVTVVSVALADPDHPPFSGACCAQ